MEDKNFKVALFEDGDRGYNYKYLNDKIVELQMLDSKTEQL